ncbi:hypothetical protein GOC16_33025 [Sinorhizobium meliloti]|nr:hypothetical protein [Sinorhizobium meliloti]
MLRRDHGQDDSGRLAVGAAAPFVFAAAMEKLGIASALFVNALLDTIGIAAFSAVAASIRSGKIDLIDTCLSRSAACSFRSL